MPCTELLHTTDGFGHTRVVPFAPPQAASVIRFADDYNGFAYEPGEHDETAAHAVWVTHDGGSSWDEVAIPQAPVDLEIAAGRAAIVTCPSMPTYCSADATLLTGPVSGNTFAVAAQLGALQDGQSRLATHGNQLRLLTHAGLLGSDDGSSWTLRPDPCAHTVVSKPYNPVRGLDGLAFDTSGRLVATCTGGFAAGSQVKVMVTSADGGQTWVQTQRPPPFAGDGADVTAGAPGVYVVGSQSGASWLYRTADGGRTWSIAYQSLEEDGFSDLGFTDDQKGFAIEGIITSPTETAATHLLLTTDAGRHWRRATLP